MLAVFIVPLVSVPMFAAIAAKLVTDIFSAITASAAISVAPIAPAAICPASMLFPTNLFALIVPAVNCVSAIAPSKSDVGTADVHAVPL